MRISDWSSDVCSSDLQTMVCVALMIGYGITAAAQEGKTNQAHVGIIYPLSTNGKTAPTDTNNFSLHLIAGVSQQENGCLIAGVSGVVKGSAYGTMISGISNHVGGNTNGVLIADRKSTRLNSSH